MGDQALSSYHSLLAHETAGLKRQTDGPEYPVDDNCPKAPNATVPILLATDHAKA